MVQPVTQRAAWDLTSAAVMPGGGISKRPLHFIIAADCSGSMTGKNMQSLNLAIATMLPQLAAWERAQENAQVLVRVLTFANEATWHIETPTPVSQVRWTPLKVVDRGLTAMGEALRKVAAVMTEDVLERRALRPAILLITDGIPTDRPPNPTFEESLAALLETPGGASALRIAIAIGDLARPEELRPFTNPDLPVLRADNADDVPDLLRAVTMAVSQVSEGVDRERVSEQLRGYNDGRSYV